MVVDSRESSQRNGFFLAEVLGGGMPASSKKALCHPLSYVYRKYMPCYCANNCQNVICFFGVNKAHKCRKKHLFVSPVFFEHIQEHKLCIEQ